MNNSNANKYFVLKNGEAPKKPNNGNEEQNYIPKGNSHGGEYTFNDLN